MRKGRVVILLAGRRAGRKAIIVKQNDEGKKVSCTAFDKIYWLGRRKNGCVDFA
jgi:ribosomal protein L14E/L6E/L27E